jgi:hypothetical protein
VPHVVGGAHPGHSLLPATIGMAALEEQQLASVTVVTAAKRLDRRGGLFVIQMTPRTRVRILDKHGFSDLWSALLKR